MLRGLKKDLGAGAWLVLTVALAGCPDERGSIDPTEGSADTTPTTSFAANASVSGLSVVVDSVSSDAAIDADAVRTVLRDAEPAFLTCLDPDGSTGVLALRLAVEDNGATRDVVSQASTTYGTDDTRACFERIVAALRFPTTQSPEPFELSISLEVRPRHTSDSAASP